MFLLDEELFSFLTSVGVVATHATHAGSRELLDYNKSFPLQAWNFRKVLLNTLLFHCNLQSILLCPELKPLVELVKDSSQFLIFFLQKQIFQRNTSLYALPDLPFWNAASVGVSVLSLFSEKPVNGQECCVVMRFVGLEAEVNASSEREEVSPTF